MINMPPSLAGLEVVVSPDVPAGQAFVINTAGIRRAVFGEPKRSPHCKAHGHPRLRPDHNRDFYWCHLCVRWISAGELAWTQDLDAPPYALICELVDQAA